MLKLPTLKPGDQVEIIAPASRCADTHLIAIKDLLTSWQLNCIVAEDIFGKDLLCANTDEARFNALKKALHNPLNKAVICARGGYGSMRLIPELTKVAANTFPKLFLGMSDITALNLFLQQQWQWPTLHGALALDKFSMESINAIKAILFGELTKIKFNGIPLNKAAKQSKILESTVTGGNLCLVQASIGTHWQLESQNKIIFLEEVGERGYKVDRMLEHLHQAKLFENATAILFGDFVEGKEPDGSSLIQPVIERFANTCNIPVVQVTGIGHGHTSYPLPLGTLANLQLGNEINLVVTC